MIKQEFPEHLKKSTIEAKSHYFERGFSINHTRMENIYRRIVKGDYSHPSYKFLKILGPTGVGKTHLARRCVNELNKNIKIEHNKAASEIPAVYCRLEIDGNKLTRWKNIYQYMINGFANELDLKIYGKPQLGTAKGYQGLEKSQSAETEEGRKRYLKDLLLYFNTKYLFVDEIQDLFRWDTNAEKSLEIMKSLLDGIDCKIIGLGTYHASQASSWSGQLIRRGSSFEFAAYDDRIEEDATEFQSTLLALLSHMPTEIDLDLSNNLDDIYLGSLGCIGLLHDWLSRAFKKHLSDGSQKFGFHHMASSCISANDRMQIAQEINEGRHFFKQLATESDVRNALYGNTGIDADPSLNHKNSGDRRPGQRNPYRDPCY